MDIVKVLVLLRLLLWLMRLQSLARVWHYLLALFINVLIWKSRFCFPLIWIPNSFTLVIISSHCYKLLLILLLITLGTLINNYNNKKGWHSWNRIGAGNYIKYYERFLLLRFKMFCRVLFYNFLLDCTVFVDWIKYFHRICLNLHATFFMA